MNEASEEEKLANASNRVVARVNNELVRRAPRLGPNKSFFNNEIFWLVNEAPAELGEQGRGGRDGRVIEPGGSRNPSDTLRLFEKNRNAVLAVERWRRASGVMASLLLEDQWALRARYRVPGRRLSQIRGLFAAFGDLRTLAWDLAGRPNSKTAAPALIRGILSDRRKRILDRVGARAKWNDVHRLADGEMKFAEYAAKFPKDEYRFSSDGTQRELRERLSRFKANADPPDPVIQAIREEAEFRNRQAHLNWLKAESNLNLTAKIPGRRRLR